MQPTEDARETRHGSPASPWRGIALWTAAILVGLALTYFAGSVVIPFLQTRAVMEDYLGTNSSYRSPSGPSYDSMLRDAVKSLGGPGRAARRLGLYLRMPKGTAPYKYAAVEMLGLCGEKGLPALVEALGSSDGDVQDVALNQLRGSGTAAIPLLADRIGDEKAYLYIDTLLMDHKAEANRWLLPKLKDSNWRARANACQTLCSTGDVSTAPAVIDALRDKHPIVRMYALWALEHISGAEYPREFHACPKCKAGCGPIDCTPEDQEAAVRFWKAWLDSRTP
jgi:hypothetical protein